MKLLPFPGHALATAFLVFALGLPLPAELVVHEAFDYAPTGATDGDGSALGDDTPHNGGIGFDGSWSQSGGDNEFEVTSPGLTFTDGSSNELAVGGNSIVRPDRGGTRAASRSLASGSTTALTGNDSTIWMSFLFEPRTNSGYNGFGPDAAITIASTTANGAANDHSLSASGYGVGIVVEDVGGSGPKVLSTGYYNGTTSVTKDASTLVPTFNQVSLLVAKIVWSTDDSSSDEIFVFNITDITSEPAEIDAIASATFDMSSTNQATIDTLNISDTQTNAIDEIRIGTSFADVVPAAAPPLAVVPTINSFTSLGGNDWEVELSGEADGKYVFYSDPDLLFDPGTLVENLTEGSAGTVGGTNSSVLTLDETGLGVVQLPLSGGSRDFIRAVAAP